MQYELAGGQFPVVICQLAEGEQIIAEGGSMAWQTPNMKMETQGGGIGKLFSRALSGENLFRNTFTAEGGPGTIAFGSSFPGKILPMQIKPGKEMILQKRSFLAGEAGIDVEVVFNKKLSTGIFGGEGFIMQKIFGEGLVFVEIDGELIEYELKPGQQLVVDTGNVAGFESTVQMEIKQVPGLKNKFLGGEGLFNTVLTGPGKVFLQTMPIYNMAMALRPFFPTGNA